MLRWEDGYYESGNSSVVTNVFGHVLPSLLLNTMGNACEGPLVKKSGLLGDQIGPDVENMSYQFFSLGEGYV
jgi:hypothetical protein